VDPEDHLEWRFVATVDLEAAMVDGAPTLRMVDVAPSNV
jgi:hypothetical protein